MDTAARIVTAAVIGVVLAGCGGPVSVTVDQPLADVADVVCGPDGTKVEPAAIRPQPDGVHLRVDPPVADHEERMLLFDDWGYEVVPPGAGEIVLALPPGERRVTCVNPEETDDPEEQAWPYPADDEWAALPALEVIDVDGVWADDTLACEILTGHHSDYEWEMTDAPMPPGRKGDPVDLARKDLAQELGEVGVIRSGDVVEPAGYGDTGRVRLVRGGKVVALIYYSSDGRGGWHLGGVEYCE